jgi:hypothetical protein
MALGWGIRVPIVKVGIPSAYVYTTFYNNKINLEIRSSVKLNKHRIRLIYKINW